MRGTGRLRGVKSEVVIASGIPFAEGPVWCDDGTLVVTSVAAGALYRVWPSEQRSEVCAQTNGGANGAALAADGSILVTQNGGIDFSTLPVVFATLPECVPAIPGLQHASPDLPSRAADHLFWLGRYAERSESIARLPYYR